MSDVKSQRQLRNRLQDIIGTYCLCIFFKLTMIKISNYTASKLKPRSELLNDEARSKEEGKRRQKEAVARLKAQQRSEVRNNDVCDLINK